MEHIQSQGNIQEEAKYAKYHHPRSRKAFLVCQAQGYTSLQGSAKVKVRKRQSHISSNQVQG